MKELVRHEVDSSLIDRQAAHDLNRTREAGKQDRATERVRSAARVYESQQAHHQHRITYGHEARTNARYGMGGVMAPGGVRGEDAAAGGRPEHESAHLPEGHESHGASNPQMSAHAPAWGAEHLEPKVLTTAGVPEPPSMPRAQGKPLPKRNVAPKTPHVDLSPQFSQGR